MLISGEQQVDLVQAPLASAVSLRLVSKILLFLGILLFNDFFSSHFDNRGDNNDKDCIDDKDDDCNKYGKDS